MTKKLDKIVSENENPIKTYKTVFPFDLFPDVLKIYKSKIVIVRNHFFFTKRVFPILMNDIKTVRVLMGPFFATLKFEIKGFETNPRPLGKLKRQDAIEARRIITGLNVMDKNDVDTLEVSNTKVVISAKKLGT